MRDRPSVMGDNIRDVYGRISIVGGVKQML